MFDPYGIYKRHQHKTHKGQIIQKKPVPLMGPVSQDDYGMIKEYAEALGYGLIKKYINPFPKELYTVSDQLYRQIMLPTYIATYSMYNVAEVLKTSTDFNRPVTDYDKPQQLAIQIDINYVFIANHQDQIYVNGNLSFPKFSCTEPIPPMEQITFYNSGVPGVGAFSNSADYEIFPWPDPNDIPEHLGPVMRLILNYDTPQQAEDMYHRIQDLDPDFATDIILRISAHLDQDTMFRGFTMTLYYHMIWEKVINSEYIGQ